MAILCSVVPAHHVKAATAGSVSKELFDKAQRAMAEEDYAMAVNLYQQVMLGEDATYKQQAHEYFAVALERSGKKARAKQAYESYLRQYPDTPGAARVQQRLSALLTLERPVQALKASNGNPRNPSTSSVDAYGGLYQYYRFAETTDDAGASETALSLLSTTADLNTRYRSTGYELGLRINGTYDKDLRSEADDDDDLTRLSYLYVYGESRQRDYAFKLGRQRDSKGGVMGRFDGLQLSAPLLPRTTLNLVGGYPVERSSDTELDTDRHFYGANIDFHLTSALDLNLFYLNQELDGFTDRRAVGGEFKYYTQPFNLYGLVDYDIHFDELNAVLLNGHYRFDSGTSANLSLNYRKSPYLTTRNALIGQQVEDLVALQQEKMLSEDEIQELALDRTFDSQNATLSLSHPLSKRFDVNGSVTYSKLSSAPESGGVAGFEGTGDEYYYRLQLTGKELFASNDTTLLGASYATLTHADIYSAYVHYRYPVTDKWRLSPKLAVQQRDNDDGSDQWILTPVLRSEYRPLRNHLIDFEAGAQLYETDTATGDTTEFRTLFFNLGYLYNF